MQKQTKLKQITAQVYNKVSERDNHRCVVCKRNDIQCHHFIPRSNGGLGIEENLIMLCTYHHKVIHESANKEILNKQIESYLKSKYPDWNKEKLKYKR